MSSQLELSWPAESQHVIFRELGTHYTRQGRYRVATTNFAKAVQANPYAVDCHYRKSVAQFRNSDLRDALGSTRDGLAVERDELDPRGEDFPCSLQDCRTVFELDEFEEHVKVTSNRSKHFEGHRLKDMQAELRLAFRNYENVLGKRAGPCLYQQRSRLRMIEGDGEQEKSKDLDGKKECDAVSVVETIVREPHVREVKRKEKNLRMLGQVHLNRGWKDLEFLSSLRKGGEWEKVVNLAEAKESSKVLSDTIDRCYDRVDAGLRSLQARTPFYTYRRNRFGSSEKSDAYLLDDKFKIRYKTYRDVHNQLDRMHELRDQGKLDQLLAYVNDVLWYYYQTKTERVFPDRYKFVNEVCNLVGLAIAESYQIPPTLMDERLKDRLAILFNLQPAKDEDDVVIPIFGDKSTYRDPAAPDYGYIAYKNKLTVLEKRIPYSRYAIERAFLYHEMCRHHLEASKLDETRIMARRVIEEATQSGSNLWKFLGILAIVRADCAQLSVEKLADSLDEAGEAALALEDERLDHVVQVARIINTKLMAQKMEQRTSLEIKRTQLE
nr:tetratricopeptide repeat protein 25-like [Aedes albopictus]